jgi:hypothetical protein
MPPPQVPSILIYNFSHKNIHVYYLQLIFFTQQSFDPAWPNMIAGFGHNMVPPQGTEHMQEEYYPGTSSQPENQGIFNEFFGADIISTQGSLIPPATQSQHVLQTPPQNYEAHTDEEHEQYGRGLRQHRIPDPWSPSGAKQRPPRRRRQG